MERTCPSCGADPGAGAFCQHCGARQTCPSCGAEPGSGAFCQHCGTRLAGDPTETPEPHIPPPPPQPEPVPTPQPETTPPPAAPAPAKGSGLRMGCLIAALVAIAVVGIGGYLAWQWISNEILPGVEETIGDLEQTAEGFTALTEAPPGPCYDLETQDGVLSGFTEVGCDGPRDAEVAFASDFEPGPWPGVEYLQDTARDTCANAFEAYVGIGHGESIYGAWSLLPTEEMWNDGNRQGVCLVITEDGSPLTGTVKGSAT